MPPTSNIVLEPFKPVHWLEEDPGGLGGFLGHGVVPIENLSATRANELPPIGEDVLFRHFQEFVDGANTKMLHAYLPFAPALLVFLSACAG